MDDFEKSNSDFYGKKTKSGFGKNVVFPFVSGVLGTTLVLGVCFGVPSVKQKLIGENSEVAQTSASQSTSTNTLQSSSSSLENVAFTSLTSYSEATAAIAKKVQPSVVGIKVEYSVNSFFNQSSTATASGSGVIISEDGYILTNNHIVNTSSDSSYYEVSKANSVKVYLYGDSTAYDATIVGTDSLTDLAVIKIDKTGLPAAELGNSDSVEVGSFAMAIGNPLGLDNSVTLGTVSAVNREVTDSDGKKFTLIQTDAAINSGNSGGALVNSYGQVIGINTLKLSGDGVEGIGFAIPINSTKDVREQLIQYGKVKRPYIGIGGINVDEAKSKYYNLPVGVYVQSVEDFSSAQKAGIKVGDVITAIDGTTITTMDELNNIKYSHSIGDTVTLKLVREGNEMEVSLTLSEQP